jgi:murein DD-endopeptidase MepM/ murein hydrolase activator NlpD
MPDGSESSSVHFGRDLWAETGTPVLAAGRGRVVLAAERFLTGNTIVLEHLPGVYTMYYHMDSMDVRIGQMVEQGTRIGASDKPDSPQASTSIGNCGWEPHRWIRNSLLRLRFLTRTR